jgi:hypothetical protein
MRNSPDHGVMRFGCALAAAAPRWLLVRVQWPWPLGPVITAKYGASYAWSCCLKVSFIVSNEIHVLYKIATVVCSLKRFQVVIGGSASLYSAQATLTVNRKDVGTLGLAEVSAVALAIA